VNNSSGSAQAAALFLWVFLVTAGEQAGRWVVASHAIIQVAGNQISGAVVTLILYL